MVGWSGGEGGVVRGEVEVRVVKVEWRWEWS